MVPVGTELINTINGLGARIKDITRNGMYIVEIEFIYLSFKNTCKNPLKKTKEIIIESNLLNEYIKRGVWKIKE